jgi:hypothetical protein
MWDMDLDTSVDELEQDIVACERLITRLRIRQAGNLRILDVHQVDHMDGARSMQEWVRARLDVSDQTARDLVHASRHLPEHSDTAEMAENGEASFDRVVATSRLVAAGADEDTIERSFRYDLNGVARLRHRNRRIARHDEADIFANRRVYIQDSFDGTHGRTIVELPGFEHLIFTKALEQRSDMFNDLPGPAITKSQRLADAAVSIAQDSLDGYEVESPSPRSDPLATVLVDADTAGQTMGEAGAEIAYGHRVGPLTLERILCVGQVQIIGLENGKPVCYSDASRSIPPAVRKAVAWRDGSCGIDGCNSRYRLQPHHIQHREHHGPDDPENLITLCWFHHHVVVHGMGLSIDPDSPPQRRRFLRACATGTDPPND